MLLAVLFYLGVGSVADAFRFLMKVFNFVLVPQGNYCERCLLSTKSISLINLLFMLLLLLASLYNQNRLVVFFPIAYFFLQEGKQV